MKTQKLYIVNVLHKETFMAGKTEYVEVDLLVTNKRKTFKDNQIWRKQVWEDILKDGFYYKFVT